MRHALPHFRYPTQLPPWYCVLRSSRYRGSVRDNVLLPLIPLAMGTGNIYTWCWVYKKRMKASKYLLPSQNLLQKVCHFYPRKISIKRAKNGVFVQKRVGTGQKSAENGLKRLKIVFYSFTKNIFLVKKRPHGGLSLPLRFFCVGSIFVPPAPFS